MPPLHVNSNDMRARNRSSHILVSSFSAWQFSMKAITASSGNSRVTCLPSCSRRHCLKKGRHAGRRCSAQSFIKSQYGVMSRSTNSFSAGQDTRTATSRPGNAARTRRFMSL